MEDRERQIEQLMEKLHSLKRLMTPEGHGPSCHQELAPSQWLVLHLVSHQEGIGIKDLASHLGITSSAATQVVNGLVNKGFLVRQASPDDRRALCLSLPEKGRRRVEAAKKQRLERIASIFKALSEEELRTFIDLADRVCSRNHLKE
ncbi:MarR family winged helix-turn-helix transcriptional regulator [Dehalogenimonas alkenigignens]|uniref:MarR family winged helix-turn-helix transcriptional regulator n=1 Tax=Dehalogenimonas alkenigignens TaxID=1217799 RepID=UPI000D5868C4|nr:MarR family transcriptional regulator [Dehalogenimonas alkenigignens]PVV82728.1 hypothetical protein DD509_08030 [Dehalogenimonas alkenigignens]